MRFLVDAQLPPALARWLATKGHGAEHVADKQMEAASDAAIWGYALLSSAAIITKDEDFAQRKVLTTDGPVVIWVRLPNTRRSALLVWFEMARGSAGQPAGHIAGHCRLLSVCFFFCLQCIRHMIGPAMIACGMPDLPR